MEEGKQMEDLKSRESWAKSKAKELGYNEDEVVLGGTHASFVKRGKAGKFTALQIRYPKTPLEFIWETFKKVVCIGSTGFLGYLVGVLIVSAFGFNYDAFGSIAIRWVLMVLGAFIGYRYNWMILFM